MQTIIKLHCADDGAPILINTNRIEAVYYDNEERETAIDFSGRTWFVKETIEEIEAIIKEKAIINEKYGM